MDATARATEAELIERCASGDHAAQAAMASHCILNRAGLLTPFEAMAYAEVFARLAAASGAIGDRILLAGVLRIRSNHIAEFGDIDRAKRLRGYADSLCTDLAGLTFCDGAEFLTGVLTAAADEGDDNASILLERLMTALSPAHADKLRRTINKAVAEHEAAHG